MTREEAITALGDRNNLLWGMSKEEQKYYTEALDMAISALETLEQIKAIIDIPNTVIQEDVIKYKMICEVIGNENRG